MCLILLAWEHDQRFQLVVGANRDEFFDRPTAPLQWWEDQPDILAGRDLEAGGTWMGVSRRARFAAVTNFREPGARLAGAHSRGALVARFLASTMAATEFLSWLEPRLGQYNGFSLLLADQDALWYASNRDQRPPRRLGPGVYGLSNHLLDTPWPKVERGKQALGQALVEDARELEKHVLGLLDDRAEASDETLPETGIDIQGERALSAIRIVIPPYGTRSSSALVVGRDGRVEFAEQSWERGERVDPVVRYSFSVGAGASSSRPK